MIKLRSKLLLILLTGIVSLGLILFIFNTIGIGIKNKLIDYSLEKEQAILPPATDYQKNSSTEVVLPDNKIVIKEKPVTKQLKQGAAENKTVDSIITQLPATANLNVPFTSQAPSGNWDLPFQEACEEASILMVDKFYKGQSFVSPDKTEDEIKKIVDFEEQKLGFHLDTNVKQTAQILKDYFGYTNVRVEYDITIEDIKKEIAQSKPVIIPAAGRMLGNPNYRQPGPLYHMLVVKGYTQTKFITNDPGTRRGKDFTYSFDKFYNAIHDWNNGNVDQGRKAMIVVD